MGIKAPAMFIPAELTKGEQGVSFLNWPQQYLDALSQFWPPLKEPLEDTLRK